MVLIIRARIAIVCQEHLCVLLIIRACHWAEAEQQCLCSTNSACAGMIEHINYVSKASKCVAHHSRMPLGEADQQCLCSANSAWAEVIENSNCVSKASMCVAYHSRMPLG